MPLAERIHASDDGEQAVRLIGPVPQRHVQPREIGAREIVRFAAAALGQEMAFYEASIVNRGRRLALGADMVGEKTGGKIGEGKRRPLLAAFVGQITAAPYARKRLLSEAARLFRRQLTEAADGHEALAPGDPVADEECLGPRRLNAQAKTFQRAVPQDVTLRRGSGSVRRSLRQFDNPLAHCPILGDHMVTTRKQITGCGGKQWRRLNYRISVC